MKALKRLNKRKEREAEEARRLEEAVVMQQLQQLANIYADLTEAIRARKEGSAMDEAANLYPRAEDGLRSMAAVFAVAESGKKDGVWVDARPPMFR